MSSRLLQSTIVQIKEATDRQVGVIDGNGIVIASSELSIMGSKIADEGGIVTAPGEKLAIINGRTFKPSGGAGIHQDYAVFVEGTDETAASLCIIAAVAISGANTYYEEKFDRTSLVKRIITDNILPGDIYVQARDLHFSADVPRSVFFIRQTNGADVCSLDVLRRMFPDKQKDFIISINETDIALVRETAEGTSAKDLHRVAANIEQKISEELGIKTVIGIGSISYRLHDLANKYKEAQVAIDVGKVFDADKTIINYESLGIGRLIYQLPTTTCEMFLSEVFKKNPIDALDDEMFTIIMKFFENNLNISETSRKLFVHRNTLVYRLDKIKKLTGLDLREFDQAIIFKVALMVKRYLDSREA